LEENHYYPFGLKHQNYNTGRRQLGKKEEILAGNLTLMPAFVLPTEDKPMAYKYKYNGKEWQDELGLNVTAMDFRMYDNALGRFHNIDAMTEIMPSLSPYRFAFNNPVIWKDPTGLMEEGDETPHIALKEVVVSAKARSTKSVHDSGLPQIHSYGFMPKNYKGVSTDYYNKKYGTDFKNKDDWYYRTKYLPFKLDMINSMHAAQAKAGQAIMLLVGSVFAAPILIASSPAIISTVSPVITNPIVQQRALDVTLNVGSQLAVNGGNINQVNMVEASLSAVNGPGAAALGEMVNVNIASLSSGNLIQQSSNLQTGIAVTGGVGSYAFGQATDSYLAGTGTKGKIVGAYFKFIVESAANAAPSSAPDEK
jgi:RHS repeat-associated protein